MSLSCTFLLFFLCFISLLDLGVRCHDRPIIGVLMQPAIPEFAHLGNAYIAASYVKYIEGAGGRVAPIDYRWSDQKLKNAFQRINGIIFPGGSASLRSTSQYLHAQKTFVDLSIKSFDIGDYFPVWGTCLGFEGLSIIISGDFDILDSFDAENISLALNFTPAVSSSRLFSQAPPEVLKTLSTKNSTMNNHMFGVSLKMWSSNTALNTFFTLLSTSQDRKGNTFASTIEGVKYPIFASQWHPEKPLYEWWSGETICHAEECVKANQYMANFLLSQARKSNHTFPNEKQEWDSLIYNYSPIYSYPLTKDFIQAYIFN